MKAKILLGQGSSLHALVSSLSPGHDSPPKAGGGLVQVLDLFCTPPPQVTGQLLQSFQSDQLPSTKKFQEKGESYVAFPQENYKKYV